MLSRPPLACALLLGLAPGAAWAQEAPSLPATGAVEPPPVAAEVVRVVERPNTAGLAIRELPAALSREEVARIQTALAAVGFEPGTRSGVLDRGTENALLAFQKRHRLAPCGCPTVETVEALGIPVLLVVQLSWAERPTPEPRRTRADSEESPRAGEPPVEYWYPVLFHRRVGFEPVAPDDGGGVDTPPAPAPRPRGARPPGVRPAPPPDGRTFPRRP